MLDTAKIRVRLALEDVKFRAREMVRRNLRKLVEIAITDLDLMASLQHITSSVAFERQHLRRAPHFKGRAQLYRYLMKQIANGDGLFLEFGVYKGDSINRLARLEPEVHWYGFDSFVGLPEDWTLGAREGAFSVGGNLPPVLGNVTLVPGFFEQTLAPFVEQHRGAKVAFLHIDCDIYSSTRTIFTELREMLQPGTVILFDEFFNYYGWQDQEFKALTEFANETNRSFEYIGYVRTGGQVAIRLT